MTLYMGGKIGSLSITFASFKKFHDMYLKIISFEMTH